MARKIVKYSSLYKIRCYFFFLSFHASFDGILSDESNNKYLGPVVQSIVSLTNTLRGQLVKCFATL